MITFDGPNLKVKIGSIGTFDAQIDFYSDWKEWVKEGDNAKFPQAFDTTGGDPVGNGQSIAPYFFLRNDLGWQIEPPVASGEIIITGNLFPRDAGRSSFDKDVAGNVLIRQIVSPQALVEASQVAGLQFLAKLLANKMITDPETGVQTFFDDDGVTELLRTQLYEDADATQTYRGRGAERREPLP